MCHCHSPPHSKHVSLPLIPQLPAPMLGTGWCEKKPSPPSAKLKGLRRFSHKVPGVFFRTATYKGTPQLWTPGGKRFFFFFSPRPVSRLLPSIQHVIEFACLRSSRRWDFVHWARVPDLDFRRTSRNVFSLFHFFLFGVFPGVVCHMRDICICSMPVAVQS